MSQSSGRRFCVFRTDRIGDVVLTLPVADVIKRNEPDAHVTFVTQEFTKDLPLLSPFVDDVLSIPSRDVRGVVGFAKLLQKKRFDVAVFAYPRPKLVLAARLAGIPIRIGTAYRYYSPLMNRRIAEHRKPALQHERDYNVRLLAALSFDLEPYPKPILSPPESTGVIAKAHLRSIGLTAEQPFIILHPGSGGSAKDWPAKNFGLFGKEILLHFPGMQALITGTTAEHATMTELRTAIGERAHILPSGSLTQLTTVISFSKLFVSNSTGPLHIAAACGTPVLGLYPFETVMNPRRWGPLGQRTSVLTPPKADDCPSCDAGSCVQHDDMNGITVDMALESAIPLVRGTSSQRYGKAIEQRRI